MNKVGRVELLYGFGAQYLHLRYGLVDPFLRLKIFPHENDPLSSVLSWWLTVRQAGFEPAEDH